MASVGLYLVVHGDRPAPFKRPADGGSGRQGERSGVG
jgi:hypothetical protein